MHSILKLDPKNYTRHLIHGENRVWAETNCYTDLIVELLHSLHYEPSWALGFTLSVDFEGEQWSFFKFHHADLAELYNVQIEEYAVWKPLIDHIDFQVKMNRPMLVELDSFFLPDTQGTAYKIANVKSTVAITEFDIGLKHMGYFHNQAYYHLSGQDFENIFQLEGLVHPRMLPPYVEVLKNNEKNVADKTESELLEISLKQLKKHLKNTPSENPFVKFKAQFIIDFEWLLKEDIEKFHAYSFANLRQYGSNFELTETYLKFLQSKGVQELDLAIHSFKEIATLAKSFQFQLARAMARKRAIDTAPLDLMAQHWETAIGELKRLFKCI